MEVAVPDEPQKKIFRARKTMKMSDRQQLEVLHNTLTSTASNPSSPSSSSSRPQTPLVNGTHSEEEQKDTGIEKEAGSKRPASPSSGSSPRPSASLSPSRSPSPDASRSRNASPASISNKVSEMSKDEETGKKDKKPEDMNSGKTDMVQSEPNKSPSDNSDQKTPADKVSNRQLSMDTAEETKSTKSLSSSPTGSPGASLECDPEVKEGFLCLSEEDEGQAEQDDVKKEKMDVDTVKEKVDTETACTAEDGTGSNGSVNKKRSWSPVDDKEEWKGDEITEERDGKRARVEGVQLEAQLELKITAKAGGRLKLEKVVQQLVEERLRVLQLTVFDQSLQELKERVDKIDAATKQQNAVQHINTLQSKISRLSKKFGAANQASENLRKESAAAKGVSVATNVNPRTVRAMIDSKQTGAATGSSSSTATPTQPKPFSTPTTGTSSALAAPAPILQIISTTTNSTPSSSSASLSGQGQTSTLLLQPRPNPGAIANTATTAGQPVSLPPLLIQLPLAMANGQGGTIAGGVNLIPVSSLGTVSGINKAKTTTATTFILQKTGGAVPSTTTNVLSAPSPTVTHVPVNRSVYQGGIGTASPSAGISVTTARTPTQSAAVVGMATASSSPATTGPAATGSAAAANGPPSASEMTSKTDNQASHSASAKTPTQSARPKSSVIDLTEDDDDVQLTGVQKPPVPTSTQRPTGPPPPLVNSTTAGRTGVQHRSSVDSPRSRPSSASSAPLPPLPSAPAPSGRLPPEAAQTSPPQQPQLKLARVQSQNGIVLSWCVSETERSCASVDSYHLYAYHQDQLAPSTPQSTQSAGQSLWKKIGEVKALPLPMACTLTQFVSGSTYYFAVRARDIYGRFGPFCEPQCTDVINPPSTTS